MLLLIRAEIIFKLSKPLIIATVRPKDRAARKKEAATVPKTPSALSSEEERAKMLRVRPKAM